MSHTVRDKTKLLYRVHRIQGQLDGLEKRLIEEKDAYGTLQLAVACRGALNALIFSIIEGHIRHHVVNPDVNPTSEQSRSAQQLIDVIRTYLK
ncbi:MAG: metal/formaldehyde-sensitive transcriptional repressor [Candidatus Hydrogenedentes bacterium]|nr:metal/formaldehyde-sensitive transcriptional repressor [Candidatus Hydrogenedentota bacterium]